VDIELEYNETPIKEHCGKCTRCIDACPTGALVAPYTLDSRRCISYLTIELKSSIPSELRPLMGNRIFGCDVCQDVCPWNRKVKPTNERSFWPKAEYFSVAPDLLSLMELNDVEFQERFKHSPIKRAKRRGFLRNVAVALGNL
jgi:epoxyqueuosine reductase